MDQAMRHEDMKDEIRGRNEEEVARTEYGERLGRGVVRDEGEGRPPDRGQA